MSEAKHTPGPWKVCQFAELFEVRSEDGMRVVRTSWHSRIRNPYPLKDEARANATLVAAAPELLSALQSIRLLVFGTYSADNEALNAVLEGRDAEVLKQVDAAIAAAKGGAS